MEVLILNSMVEEIIFGNILRVYGTLDNHFPAHGSSIYDLDQIHEILLGLEAANKLGVIWRAEREKQLSVSIKAKIVIYSIVVQFLEHV